MDPKPAQGLWLPLPHTAVDPRVAGDPRITAKGKVSQRPTGEVRSGDPDAHIATLRGNFLDYCDDQNLDATFEPVRV
jgi:hypothetical protein